MKKNITVFECSILELDKHSNEKGNVSIVENEKELPFNINRVYYLYDVPGGEDRGAHAHKELRQLIIAASGSFDLVLNDGNNKRKITLNRPYIGLLVVPGIWREIVNFSSGSICMVVASHKYDEDDYIRNYEGFLKFKKEK